MYARALRKICQAYSRETKSPPSSTVGNKILARQNLVVEFFFSVKLSRSKFFKSTFCLRLIFLRSEPKKFKLHY